MDGSPLPSDSKPESDPWEEPTEEWIELTNLEKDPKLVTKELVVEVHAVSVKVSVAASVTSSIPKGEPRTIPYQVYAELVRECDIKYGQNMELRRLVELVAGGTVRGMPTPSLVPDARIRIRTLTEIAARHMEDLSSTSKEEMDPKGMTRLAKWLVYWSYEPWEIIVASSQIFRRLYMSEITIYSR